jgi:hypothetical protein
MTVVSSPYKCSKKSMISHQSALTSMDRADSFAHLEAGNTLDVVSQDVKLLLGTLVVVSLPLQPDPDPVRGRSDTSGPDGLVETGGDSNVLNTHRLLSKLDDRLDGLGSPCRRSERD